MLGFVALIIFRNIGDQFFLSSYSSLWLDTVHFIKSSSKQESIIEFVKLLRVHEHDKKRLLELTPEEYIGIAPTLVSLK